MILLLLVILLLVRLSVAGGRLLIIYIVTRIIAGVRIVLVLFSLSVAAGRGVITFQVSSINVLVFLACSEREREGEVSQRSNQQKELAIFNMSKKESDRLPGEMKPRPQYLQMYGNSLVCL